MEREARTDKEKTSKMSKTEMVATEKAVEYSEAPYKPKSKIKNGEGNSNS